MKNFVKLLAFALLLNTIAFAGNDFKKELSTKYKEAESLYQKKSFVEVISLSDRINSIEKNQYADYYKALSLIKLLPLTKDENEFNSFLNECENILKKYDEKNLDGEFGLLKANLLMMKISKYPTEAATISKKIFSIFGLVESIISNNPRLYLTRGLMLFHMPEVFGGSKDKALEQFKLAEKYYEKESGDISWGKYENLVWMAKTNEFKKDFNSAKKIYDKILSEAPEFSWVKYNLLPNLLNSRKNNVKLNIKIIGLPNNKGALRLAIYKNEKDYEKSLAYKAKTNYKINDRSTEIIFDDLNPGTYAIKCYHDENDNEILDTNGFGIPNESYGFSNNAMGMFGPPSFDDAKFNITLNDTIITIKMK